MGGEPRSALEAASGCGKREEPASPRFLIVNGPVIWCGSIGQRLRPRLKWLESFLEFVVHLMRPVNAETYVSGHIGEGRFKL